MKSPYENKTRVSLLVELSLKGLENLYDMKQGLFVFYIKGDRRVLIPISWSICYTAIALLGLNKVDFSEFQELMGFDKTKALKSLVYNWNNAGKFGHLGLI